MKTMLVTGASSGIGRALAVRAARAGYAVYGVGRNAAALAALSVQVTDEGGIIATDIADVATPLNAPGIVGRMIAAFGHVDVLVNNAGAVAAGPIAAQSDADVQAQFGTHVIGPLALVREALPSLRAGRGHVFMLGSGVARVPVGGLGAYPPSKAALRSATTILRRELAPLEIAVTYVDPGAVDTAFMSRAGMPGASAQILVSPELVARKILLAVGTRPNVLNVAPLQTAAVAVAELLPALTEAILERNPALVGAGPALALKRASNDAVRPEKLALPPSTALRPEEPAEGPLDVVPVIEPEPAPVPEPELAPEPEPTLVGPEPEPEPQPLLTATAVTDVPAPAVRWAYEPPEADDAVIVEPALESVAHDDEPAHATSSFDAALEPLRARMDRSKLSVAFVRELLAVDGVLDVGETAMRWAGMPNKHERSLTSEVFFALAEWGFLAPRADGRYRVIRAADDAIA